MRRFNGYMHGIDIGGWLSQCDYSKEHLDNFITEEDIKRIKGWGCDHVRVPVDYNIFQDENGFIESGFDYVQKCIDWCGNNGINMILDLHKTLGFFFDKAQAESGFFDNAELQQKFYDLWEEFAKRFSKYSDRISFELLNEVTDPKFSKKWNAIVENAIKLIRRYSADINIIVGSYWNNSIDSMKDLDKPYDEHIVYTFHCYDPFLFTHQAAYWVDEMPRDFRIDYPGSVPKYRSEVKRLGLEYMQTYEEVKTEKFTPDYFMGRFAEAVRVAEERNVPMYCGEYGVINLASAENTLNWYKDISSAFEKCSIGRAAWSYKGVDYGFIDGHFDSVLDELVKYL